jgi:hypothetical protein
VVELLRETVVHALQAYSRLRRLNRLVPIWVIFWRGGDGRVPEIVLALVLWGLVEPGR